VPVAWPFEGRESELSQIRAAFDEGELDAVILTAPAGVGKTRLAREVQAFLAGPDTSGTLASRPDLLWIAGTRAAAAIPFGAVASLLPESAPLGAPLEVMRATARHIQSRRPGHREVIAVDDAHLLDDASSTLIAHLVINRVAFVLITVRSGEPLADVLAALRKEGHAARLDLARLPDTVMDRLIDHAAPEHLDAVGRRRLRRIAQGNPLALRELLHGAEPGGLMDLIAARLDGLDPSTRHVVELVACGEPLSLKVLERLVGLSSVLAAERSGLIVVERSGARVDARLDHPLYGEVLRSRMTLTRATLVYRLLAEALLSSGLRRRTDILLAAVWQVEAGLISRPDVVRQGAWQAIGHAGLELAERLARAARMAEPGDEADRLLAEILAYRGRSGEAWKVLPPLPPTEPANRVEWAITRAETMYWGGDDLAAAEVVLDTAAGHEAAEAARSWLLFFDGRCAEAARVAATVLDRPDSMARAVIWAAAAGCAANGFLGHLQEATRIHQRGAALAAAHIGQLPWGSFEVDVGACLAHLACGQPSRAQGIADAGYRDAVAAGPPMMISGWALYAGLAAAARGHLNDAARLLAEASAGFEINDTFRLGRCCLAAHAAVAAVAGDPGAQTLLKRADALAHPSNRVLAPWIDMWRAWTAYATADLVAATTAAARAASLARDAGMPGVEALALFELTRLGVRTDLARLDAIDDALARLLAATARAIAGPNGAEELEAAADQLQERGLDLHAAEALSTAAVRHQRRDRYAQADLAQGRANQLRGAFPTARTPLLDAPQVTNLLTPREREIVLLAVDHTSAQIAARLELAVPTVNNNLARAYVKLGIRSRAELRALLCPARPPSDSS